VVNASNLYVNQQEGAFTVIVSLKKGIFNALTGAQPAAVLDEPLTVDFVASLDPTGSGTTATTRPIAVIVHESVTSPAGASTKTVAVPISSSVAKPVPVLIHPLDSGTTEAASPFFAPVHESITFPAGA
jgi:hypothetical protein